MKLVLVLYVLILTACGVDSSLANEAIIRQKSQCDAAKMDSEVLRNGDNVPIAIRCVPRSK